MGHRFPDAHLPSPEKAIIYLQAHPLVLFSPDRMKELRAITHGRRGSRVVRAFSGRQRSKKLRPFKDDLRQAAAEAAVAAYLDVEWAGAVDPTLYGRPNLTLGERCALVSSRAYVPREPGEPHHTGHLHTSRLVAFTSPDYYILVWPFTEACDGMELVGYIDRERALSRRFRIEQEQGGLPIYGIPWTQFTNIALLKEKLPRLTGETAAGRGGGA